MRLTLSIIFLITFSCCYAGPLALVGKHSGRKYHPAEEDELHTKFLLVQNEIGHPEVVDLANLPLTHETSESDVSFYLYTQQNTDDAERFEHIDEVSNSKYFDPKKQTIFISHGWNNDYTSSVNTLITAAVLKRFDFNVFAVDWGVPAHKNYFTAKDAVITVGKCEGEFIKGLIEKYSMSPNQFILVGHSLGAHVAGNAGAVLEGKLLLIVGLDPAGPLFSIKRTDNRLDVTDARYVEIIHTSAGLLGFSSSIGHMDFYPNGGSHQTGCGLDLFAVCSHSKSYIYFAKRIENAAEDTLFLAEKCSSYEDYKSGNCADNPTEVMGSISTKKVISGDFYLDLNF